MTNFPRFDCEEILVQAYREAQSLYGPLDLSTDTYLTHLVSIIRRYLSESPSKREAVDFLGKTHTTDLYLTIACAHGSEAGWERLFKLYHSFVCGLAAHFCSTEAVAHDLANKVITDLFMSSRSKRPRIASYDGQSSLSAWLRVIVLHRAINERARKWNLLESLDDLPEMHDDRGLERIEASLRSSRYRPIILNTFRCASQKLNSRERYILLMIHEEKLRAKEVARLLGVHPSSVTRQLQQTHRKIRQEVISILAHQYNLSEEAIRECLTDILESPEHSLLDILKAG